MFRQIAISDDYADWESAYISPALNKTETEFAVKTLAVVSKPVVEKQVAAAGRFITARVF